VPISEEKRLALAMALNPALAPDSQLFQIASIPLNPLKAGKRPYLYLQRCASMRHIYVYICLQRCGSTKYAPAHAPPTMHQHAPGRIYASKYALRLFFAAFSIVSTVHVCVRGSHGAAIKYNLNVTSERHGEGNMTFCVAHQHTCRKQAAAKK
jgi:hypothetical protein